MRSARSLKRIRRIECHGAAFGMVGIGMVGVVGIVMVGMIGSAITDTAKRCQRPPLAGFRDAWAFDG